MHTYMTPEESAELLKIEAGEIISLIEEGRLRAIRLGNSIRIREADLEEFLDTCAFGGNKKEDGTNTSVKKDLSSENTLPDGARWCLTRRGKRFRVRGSVKMGAEIWPGQMKYPVKFPADFMHSLLKQFAGKVVDVGGSFDGPTPGSLGEFIKRKLNLTLQPAVYVAALLIDEGFAELAGRGKIRFVSNGRLP